MKTVNMKTVNMKDFDKESDDMFYEEYIDSDEECNGKHVEEIKADEIIYVYGFNERFSEFNRCLVNFDSEKQVCDKIRQPNGDKSWYEYLKCGPTFSSINYKPTYSKFFMDIENIPAKSNSEDRLLLDIIDDFLLFIGFYVGTSANGVYSIEDWSSAFHTIAITKNEGSRNHEGDSYHVIFNGIRVSYNELKHWMYAFVSLYPQYKRFVDITIYKSGRLFKLPNQYGVDKDGIHVRPSNNIHRPYMLLKRKRPEVTCKNDFRRFDYIVYIDRNYKREYLLSDDSGSILSNDVLKQFIIQNIYT